jgi:hypothetical protein
MTQPSAIAPLQVKYFHPKKGLCSGNIIWAERDRGSSYYRISKYAMAGGKFPQTHPAAPGQSVNGSEMGDSPQLRAFRERGYWASCFPEGDGITFKFEDERTPEQVIKDITEVFGWDVKNAK